MDFGALVALGFAFSHSLWDYAQGFVTVKHVLPPDAKPGASPVTTYDVDWVLAAWAVGKFLLFWLVGSAVTAFLYWVSFVRDVKARFLKNLEAITERFTTETKTFSSWSERAKTSIGNALALGTYSDNVFLDDSFRLSVPDTFPSMNSGNWYSRLNLEGVANEDGVVVYKELDQLDAAVAKVLPPRIKHNKLHVTYAATVWPVTLLSLLLADLVRHVWEFLLNFWHQAFDAVSKWAFGDMALPKNS